MSLFCFVFFFCWFVFFRFVSFLQCFMFISRKFLHFWYFCNDIIMMDNFILYLRQKKRLWVFVDARRIYYGYWVEGSV